MRARTAREAIKPLLEPMLEPILHPSQWRIRALCTSIVVGHPVFYAIWTYWLPQPYESLWQRLLVSALGLGLLSFPKLLAPPPTRMGIIVISLVFWLTVPVYFTWMYLCNGRNAVWLGTMSAMFLIYYHASDWRLATVGMVAGLAAGWLLFTLFGPDIPPPPADLVLMHGVVFAFSWYMALMFGLSASNLRREQLKQALETMGIMAHELRTPLATMSLIGDAVRNQAQGAAPETARNLELLASRMQKMVRNMNRQIDTQINNAQLMQLPGETEVIGAAALVRKAAAAFPYRDEGERSSVSVRVHEDFEFEGSEALFHQVLDNLMKNALRSLAATTLPRSPGDLTLTVEVDGRQGLITVADRGVGISEMTHARLFQPFVSTNQGTAHGLGLAFCRRVLLQARGSIEAISSPGFGARFILRVPLLPATPVAQPSFERSFL